jgi:hypothetical protein
MVKIDWKQLEKEYKFWTSQKGCQLNDNWIYLALLDLNERIKKLEKKDYDRKNKKIRNKN